MATKIGLGEITDINLNNFGMLTGGAKPGSPTYENALARLVEKGGDDLKGVTDPIERMFSSVSRFIEENGMTETMQAEHTRMTEALKDGRELSPFNREMHRSRDFGLTMREASLAAPSVSAAPTTSAPPKTAAPAEELIEGMYGPTPPKVKSSSTALADLEQEWNRARKLKPRPGEAPISDIGVFMQRAQESSLAATDVTRKSIEDHGYLYHYAPREHRESILSEGLMTSKARTAAADAALPGISKGAIPSGGMYFFTNPEDAPSAVHVVSGGVQGLDKQGADLYRVKIEPGMLDDMVVDWKLPIRPDAASAVIVTNKSGAFKPELIGEDAKFGRRDVEYKPVVSDHLIEPAVAPQAPSVAPTSPQSAVATETYDHGAGVSKSTASGETLSESPPPKSTRRGPGDIGKPADDIRTRPSSRGADAASTTTTTPKPPPTTGSVAMDPPKVTTAPPSSGAPSKAKTLLDDAAEAARNVARGHGNAKALGIAGAAALLGVGYASTKSKKSVNRED